MPSRGLRPQPVVPNSVSKKGNEKSEVYRLDQVAIRMVEMPPLLSDVPLDSPQAAVKVMADMLKDYDREVVAIVNIRSDGRPINMNIVSMGTLNQSMVHPRELLKSTILSNAASIMMVHNHPSNRLIPSEDDIATTDRIKQLCDLVGISFLDHIIVGPGGYYFSFCQKDQIPLSSLKLTNRLEDIELEGLKVAENNQKQISWQEIKDKRANELQQITDKLEKGVSEIFESEKYKQFLNTMAKFPRYSVNNSILIMMQKPDAQLCQSFTGWKQMGRFVKKGEKGISILAPAPYKIEKEQYKLDENGNQIYDKDGEPVTEKTEVTVRAFKVVKTFDLSQTDGQELPKLGVDELTGSVDSYPKLMDALTEICPVPISFEQIDSGAKGYYSQVDKKIVIQKDMSQVQTIKTLIHEMSHQKLHDKDLVADAKDISRNGKEVEAESVSFVVCSHYNIDVSDYSFSYIVGYSKGKETPELKDSLNKIRQTAADFITQIDEKLELSREMDKVKIAPEKAPNPELADTVNKELEKMLKQRKSVKDKIKETESKGKKPVTKSKKKEEMVV